MKRVIPWLVAAPVIGLAFALALGVGMVREGNAVLVSLLAGAVVLLPAAGLVAPLGERRADALPWAALVWAAALPVCFPLYFPDERDDAFAAGFAVFGAVVGQPPDARAALWLDARLPALQARRLPAPPAAPALAARPSPPPAPAKPLATDAVVLPYEGTGASLSVPVVLEGTRGQEVEVSMIFDTGASLTTLDMDTLTLLGLRVPPDAPKITFQTANGERTSALLMVDRVWLGGLPVEGVTVGVCEQCANDDDVGLLGLNVSRRFLVTVDQARQELVLEPRADAADAGDVKYWVEVASTATRWPDGRMEVEVDVENRAPRDVAWVDVEIRCGDPFTARVPKLRAGDARTQRVSLPPGTSCAEYTVAVTGAAWER